MIQSIRVGILSLLGISLIFDPLYVSGDLRVVDIRTREVVFETASDFVRTGCGSFVAKSYLVSSNPPTACEVPDGPPTAGWLWKLFEIITGESENERGSQWVLLAEDGECDLKTKFRNAATAGYAGIIVGTEDVHEDIIKPGLVCDDDEEFIDVHLVNPLDIRVISKKFTYPKQFILDPPSLSRCKEEYQRTWLRSRYVSLVIRVLKSCNEICMECGKWIIIAMGKVTVCIKSLLPSVFHNKDTFSSITISLASILTSITIVMIISIQNTAKKLMKYKHQKEQSPNEPRRESESCGYESDDNNFSDAFDSPKSRSYSHAHVPPRNEIPIDYTLYHRINLNIKITETLTKTRVNNAYRDMALKYHPDKNRHLSEQELGKITEEFRLKKESRDILLRHCAC